MAALHAKLSEQLGIIEQLAKQGVPLSDCTTEMQAFLSEALAAAFSGDQLRSAIENAMRDALARDAREPGGGEAFLHDLQARVGCSYVPHAADTLLIPHLVRHATPTTPYGRRIK